MLERSFNDSPENPPNANRRPSSLMQDRDLFSRLNQYLDDLELHLQQGRGWFIFNADRNRATRITTFIRSRVEAYQPQYTFSFIPWRDFSLNSYMLEVELGDNNRNEQQLNSGDPHLKQELNIARRVTYDTSFTMLTCDLLTLSGLQPRQPHELRRLEYVISRRQSQHLTTILLTPHQPHELAEMYDKLAANFWTDLYGPLYETCLLAF